MQALIFYLKALKIGDYQEPQFTLSIQEDPQEAEKMLWELVARGQVPQSDRIPVGADPLLKGLEAPLRGTEVMQAAATPPAGVHTTFVTTS